MDQPRKAKMTVTVEFMQLARKSNIIPICQQFELDNSKLTVNLDTHPLPLDFRFRPGADRSKRRPAVSPSIRSDVPPNNPSAHTCHEGKAAPETHRSLTVEDGVSNETSWQPLHAQGKLSQSEPRERRAFEALKEQGSKEWESYIQKANFQVNLQFEQVATWLAISVHETIERMKQVVDKHLFSFLKKPKENCKESVHCSTTFNNIYLKDIDQAIAENVDVTASGDVFRLVEETLEDGIFHKRTDITYCVRLELSFSIISCNLCNLKREEMSMEELCSKFIWQ